MTEFDFDSPHAGVTALLNLNDRHPMLTGIVGSASGLSTWLFGHIDGITRFAACIGTVATAGIAVLTLGIKIAALIRGRRPRVRDEEDDLPWS